MDPRQWMSKAHVRQTLLIFGAHRQSRAIILGDKAKCNLVGIGKVGDESSPTIEDVYLVKALNFNLLSILQLYDKGNEAIFNKDECHVININIIIKALAGNFIPCALTKCKRQLLSVLGC